MRLESKKEEKEKTITGSVCLLKGSWPSLFLFLIPIHATLLAFYSHCEGEARSLRSQSRQMPPLLKLSFFIGTTLFSTAITENSEAKHLPACLLSTQLAGRPKVMPSLQNAPKGKWVVLFAGVRTDWTQGSCINKYTLRPRLHPNIDIHMKDMHVCTSPSLIYSQLFLTALRFWLATCVENICGMQLLPNIEDKMLYSAFYFDLAFEVTPLAGTEKTSTQT